jgi:hypothetical protein
MMRALLLAATIALAAPSALAHKPSDAYLTIERDGARLSGRWDIALRDLETAVGLDADGDGSITWGEVRAKQAALDAYALSRLTVSSAGHACALEIVGHAIDSHTDGAYAVMELSGSCASVSPTLRVDYRLLFDVDPTHRGLLNYVEQGQSRATIFSADAPTRVIGRDIGGRLVQFAQYLREGVWHIWTGFDHMLFLLSLLLPAVLVRHGNRWTPAPSLRAALIDIAKVVTAFTLAHSATLTMATLGLVTLPARFVESAIAVSVVLAALNNVRPVVGNGRWIAAFGFGLLHGFGFAGALRDLGLPSASLALSLAGFNVGVEIGQLAIVAAFMPLAFALRGRRAYARYALSAGSLAIAVVAAIWFVERAFDLPVVAAIAARG